MKDFDEHDRELEELLDQAGQWCKPRHPGWDTLLERLGSQQASEGVHDEVPTRRAHDSLAWKWLALAAGLLLAVIVAGSLFLLVPSPQSPEAAAANLEIEVQRRGIELTVFNASDDDEPTLYTPTIASHRDGASESYAGQTLTQRRFTRSQAAAAFQNPREALARGLYQPASQGMGLVKDQRMVLHLKAGDNIVKFTDVAASIDPTSVRLVSETDPTGTQVVEQNFEFDLASADALLKRYLDRRVVCLGRGGQGEIEGFLVSFDASTLLLADRAPDPDPKAARPKTQSIARRSLQAIRVDQVPADLHTRPTLVWKLRTKTPGDHLTTLSYLCGDVVWQADYVATITKSEPSGRDTLDLTGWVTIDNRSGTTYEQAGLKLIAGDVNRVRDPWAAQPEVVEMVLGVRVLAIADLDVSLKRKEFAAKDFFEYKLYTLNQPSTIKDQQIKQLGLLQATGIRAQRRFLYDPQKHPDRPAVELVVKNEKANQLGRPLPKGRVTFVALDAEGESHFLGRDQIDHTPKDEELELKIGQAFDVVGESRVLNTQRPHERRLIQTCEIRLRNHKDAEIACRAVAHLEAAMNWQVTQTSDAYRKHDFRTLHFDFRLKPDSEKRITYTVDYQWIMRSGDHREEPRHEYQPVQ